MKKVLFAVAMLCCVSVGYGFEWSDVKWKVMPGMGMLQSPDLGSFEGVTKGGVSFYGQAFLKSEGKAEYGVEIGYVPIYKYEYNYTGLGFNWYTWDYETVTYKESYSVKAIPLQGVVKYYLGEKDKSTKPFLTGAAGLNFVSITGELLGISVTSRKTYLGLGFGGGFEIKAGEKTTIEPTLRYNIILSEGDNLSMLNLGVAVGFEL